MSNSKRDVLEQRAKLFAALRAFFHERGVLEVDCPALSLCGSLDAHIDLIEARVSGKRCYLHSSPEYHMKRLLAEGSGDIYQLGHVYRDGEQGALHEPEFSMAEWYRVGISFEEMIDETLDCIELALGAHERRVLTYRDAFLRFVDIDPFLATEEQLLALCTPYEDWELEGRDALLHLILTERVEPELSKQGLTVIRDYPASQAALARSDGETARRFEIYFAGIELANGYHELSNADEQRQRFEEANRLRVALGKEPMPIDDLFLDALGDLPDCCGVALGLDRLLMLQKKSRDLSSVLPCARL